MTEHAPSPWFVHRLPENSPGAGTFEVLDAHGKVVCRTRSLQNANRIAALPLLLEALRRCVAQYDERAWTDPASPNCPVHAARAAIQAAEPAS